MKPSLRKPSLRPGTPRRNRSRGSALLLVVLMTLVLATALGAATRFNTYQTRDVGRYEVYKDEFAAAEEGLAKGYGQIRFLLRSGSSDLNAQAEAMPPPADSPSGIVPQFEYKNWDVRTTFDGEEAVVTGPWAGLSLRRQRYNIQAGAVRVDGYASGYEHPGVTLNQTVELTYVPLYLFAIFYDQVMEIAPGAAMTINGRVHSNRPSYVQTSASLDFMMPFTSAGPLYYGRNPYYNTASLGAQPAGFFDGSAHPAYWSDASGPVRFNNGSGTQTLMNSGSTYLDARSANWYADSNTRWNNTTNGAGETNWQVRDESHGASELTPPIPPGVDPHTLIERANGSDSPSLRREKFEYKAGLKILREGNSIVGRDQAGNVIPLTYTSGGQTVSVVSTPTFYDMREQKNVTAIEVDMTKLRNAPNGGPLKSAYSNGIVYVSNENVGSNTGVVRLVNGATLPASTGNKGFSVVTDDPLYIKGDYNSTASDSTRPPALLAADAIMILSNAWSDNNSSNTSVSARNASSTTTNAVFMSGIVPSGSKEFNGTKRPHYSGGVENYYRYLETWSGDTHTVKGSIIGLWASQTFRTAWNRPPNFPNSATDDRTVGNIYGAPNRNWSWDTRLGGINGGPPGTTAYIEIRRIGWKVGEYDG